MTLAVKPPHVEAPVPVPLSATAVGEAAPPDAVERRGDVAHLELHSPALDCASCAATVEKAVRELPGIGRVTADAVAGRVVVDCEPAHVSEAVLRSTITAAGYSVHDSATASEVAAPGDREEGSRRREYRQLMRKVWVAGAVSVPVVLLSYPTLFPVLRDLPRLASGSDGLLWTWRELGLLTLPILIWGGSQFFRGAWAAAKAPASSATAKPRPDRWPPPGTPQNSSTQSRTARCCQSCT